MPNRCELLNHWLQAHSLVVEFAPAVVTGACGAAAGFGLGLALGDFALAVILALICGVVGGVVGNFITSLSLFVLLTIMMLIYPTRWWFPVVAACVAATGTVFQTIRLNMTIPEMLLCLVVYSILTEFAVEFAYAIALLLQKLFRPRLNDGQI